MINILHPPTGTPQLEQSTHAVESCQKRHFRASRENGPTEASCTLVLWGLPRNRKQHRVPRSSAPASLLSAT